MKTDHVVTTGQMKAEAVSRMKALGLKQEYIDAFSVNIGYEITEFWSKWVKGAKPSSTTSALVNNSIDDFEQQHSALVWAVIHDLANEDGVDWDGYYMLYVSSDPQLWEEERAALLAHSPKVYYKAVSEDCELVNTGFDEIKIEMKDGVLYGDL